MTEDSDWSSLPMDIDDENDEGETDVGGGSNVEHLRAEMDDLCISEEMYLELDSLPFHKAK